MGFQAAKRTESKDPRDYYDADIELKRAIDTIDSGPFSHGDKELFRPLTDHLFHHDDYLLMADYRAYVDCQDEVNRVFHYRSRWTRVSIINAARMGRFSSDRAIDEYACRIWNLSSSLTKTLS
jgi:glycogen phosphorylase